MNEVMKRFVEIADEKQYEIVSIEPIFEDDELFEEAIEKLNELFENFNEELDLIYVVRAENNVTLIFPVIKNVIREDLMLESKEEEYIEEK